MEERKEDERKHFLAAYKRVDERACGSYKALLHPASTLFSASGGVDASFAEKRKRFREAANTGLISAEPDGPILCDLACSWAEANLYADTSDEDWFEASTDHVLQLGAHCQSREGLDALLWSHDLGVQLHLYSFGLLQRVYGGQEDRVAQRLRQQSHRDAHPTIRVLHCIPRVLDGLSSFLQSEAEQKSWIASGGNFIGRLLYTHAFSVGLERLAKEEGLFAHLSVVNGAMLSWPYPQGQDCGFTTILLEKMSAPNDLPPRSPGYDESEVWSDRLLTAARAYLESFQHLFCERDNRDFSDVDAWKKLGTSLQVFSELVLYYEIGLREPP